MADNPFKFNTEEEEQIDLLRKSVKEKADYDLRRVISITERVNKKVDTGKKNEYGDTVEDWDNISTKELVNIFSEANAWNFFSTPVRMNAFIESSLAEIIYKYNYATALTDPNVSGTVAVKQSLAELNTQDSNFSCQFRKLYTSYVTDVLKSFDQYTKRMEKIIDWRMQEERMNANKSPFTS